MYFHVYRTFYQMFRYIILVHVMRWVDYTAIFIENIALALELYTM